MSKIIHQNVEGENYAQEVLTEQYNNGWGGLTEEVVNICQKVGLKNGCEVFLTRAEVKEAMLYHHLSGLKEEMKARKKLDRISNEDCRMMQQYMMKKSLEDSRLEFRWRTGMLDCRAWMPAKYGGVKACPHCPEGREAGEEESGVHWLTCQAYSRVRQGLDPEGSQEDRIVFLRRVQLIRTELEK